MEFGSDAARQQDLLFRIGLLDRARLFLFLHSRFTQKSPNLVVTVGEVQQVIGFSYPRACRLLKFFVDYGLLRQVRAKRGETPTKYFLYVAAKLEEYPLYVGKAARVVELADGD